MREECFGCVYDCDDLVNAPNAEFCYKLSKCFICKRFFEEGSRWNETSDDKYNSEVIVIFG